MYVQRSEIADIDHPGNVLAVVGGVITGYGLLNIAVGASDCSRNGSAYCTGVFLPAAVGLPLLVGGIVNWSKSQNAANNFGPPNPGFSPLAPSGSPYDFDSPNHSARAEVASAPLRRKSKVKGVDESANELPPGVAKVVTAPAVTRLSVETGCDSENIRLVNAGQRGKTVVARFDACGGEFSCEISGDATCERYLPPANVPDKMLSRLGMELGCDPSGITITQTVKADRETLVRVAACGNYFVCSVESERQSCKRALVGGHTTDPEGARALPDDAPSEPRKRIPLAK